MALHVKSAMRFRDTKITTDTPHNCEKAIPFEAKISYFNSQHATMQKKVERLDYTQTSNTHSTGCDGEGRKGTSTSVLFSVPCSSH